MKNIGVRLGRAWAFFFGFISLVILAGCSSHNSPSVVSVEVAAAKTQLALGTSQQYSATAIFSDGSKRDVTRDATWASTQPSVATVGNASPTKGLAATKALGTTLITATFSSASGNMALTVTPAVLTSIDITPAASVVPKGVSKQLTATGTFTDGTTQDITSGVTWSSSDDSTVTVSNVTASAGLAQTFKQGSVTVSAVMAGVTGSTSLTVTTAVLSRVDVAPTNPTVPKGLSKQFSATGVFSDGTTQDLTAASTWVSSSSSVATVVSTGATAGLAQTLAQGATTVSATTSGVTGSTTLTVTAAELTSIDITPSTPSVPNGLSKQFTATGTFTDGSTQNITATVVWHSSTTSVATISNAAASAGLAQTVAQGTSTISAQSGDVSGSTTLTVAAAVLSKIDVTPINPSVPKGLSKQFVATGTFTDGTTQDITAGVTWSSSNTSASTISNAPASVGLAQTLAQGTSTISAQSAGVTGTVTLTVTAAELASIGITPATPSIAKGLSQQFTAMGTYTDGSTQNLTASVTWDSSDLSIATISNAAASAGLAQSAAQGTTTISAAKSGVTATTVLTVTAATLTRLDVTPANPTVPKGLTKQFTATGVFTDGSNSDLTSTVTWASSDAAVAPVSNAAGSNGLAAANAQGTATISASSQGVTGSATLTVSAASLISIQVTPTNPTLAAGFSRPLTATGRYSDGTTQDITQQVTWGSTNTAAATVNNSAGNQGVASGIAAGSTTATAQLGSIIGQTSLTITNATLSSIQVSPATANIALGTKQKFIATGVFSDSTTLDVSTQVSWSSSDTTIATISNAVGSVGLASSIAQGSVVISAQHVGSGVSGTANLTVSQKSLVSISVNSAVSSVPNGGNVAFTATGTYTDNSSGDITDTVTWSSSDTTVVTISNAAGSNGLATATATGDVTITAQQGGVHGSKALTVTPAILTRIDIAPSTVSVPKGLKQQYTATGVYSDNTQQDLTQTVTWTSSVPTIATISNASGSIGLATTLSEGTVTISAALGGVSGSTSLTVTPVSLTSITLSPANAFLPNGQFQQYLATGNYSDGSSANLTKQVTWQSSNAGIADISNATGSEGMAVAKAVGGVIIKAIEPTSGVSGTTALTVTTAQLVGINVAAVSRVAKVSAGYSTQYVAMGQYSDGSQQDITATSNWTSFNTQVAVVGNTTANKGLVQGIAIGSTSISASLNGVSGTGPVSVTGATVSSIVVTPANTTVPKGQVQQYTAVGTFTDGSVSDVTTQVLWSSSNAGVADVSNAAASQGLVTAKVVGDATISATDAVSGTVGSTQLHVGAAKLLSISVAPAPGGTANVPAGYSSSFIATGTYSDGSQQDITSIGNWTTGSTGTATVSNAAGSNGVVSGVAAGSTSLTLSFNGVSGTLTVTVTNATLSSIAVTPANATIHPNGTLQYSSVGTFSDGSKLGLTQQVTWASSNTAAATISNAAGSKGLASAGGLIGTTTISATTHGVTGSTQLTRALN